VVWHANYLYYNNDALSGINENTKSLLIPFCNSVGFNISYVCLLSDLSLLPKYCTRILFSRIQQDKRNLHCFEFLSVDKNISGYKINKNDVWHLSPSGTCLPNCTGRGICICRVERKRFSQKRTFTDQTIQWYKLNCISWFTWLRDQACMGKPYKRLVRDPPPHWLYRQYFV